MDKHLILNKYELQLLFDLLDGEETRMKKAWNDRTDKNRPTAHAEHIASLTDVLMLKERVYKQLMLENKTGG